MKGKGSARETPIGLVPTESGLDWNGLALSASERRALLQVDRRGRAAEVKEIGAFFGRFGDRLPPTLERSLAELEHDLASAVA